MKELEYPFDSEVLIKKRKSLKKQLCNDDMNRIQKKIAVLGGFTTQNITQILELFLLNYGIEPEFYESEYNKYYEDGMFPNPELESFGPDLIYICTCNRNIVLYPEIVDTKEVVQDKLGRCLDKFIALWEKLKATYHCPIIQNNFEYPFFRLMGNKDASDYRGRVNFITELNRLFYEYCTTHENIFICDINYISASYGLEKWSDLYYWYMYKYAVAVPAIPYLSYNVANIIKSLYGKNKKAFNFDLDNTLWGGVVGDDGADNIEIGQDTSLSQVYSEFQEYIKLHKQMGVLLTINSKNENVNAIAGLSRPDSVLHPDDFIAIKANWEPKSINLVNTANELNLLPESFVFVDDNPTEREIIVQQVPGVAISALTEPEHYIQTLDKAGYFEVTSLSEDDLKRTRMYEENAKRSHEEKLFTEYSDFLKSLEMKAEIRPFAPVYYSRVAQLTNKSNQFNLTTRRYSQGEIEEIANNPEYITLYGKLEDRFGDNGIVSAVIGHIGKNGMQLHIDLWIMSCRVLKRDMEFAMMDILVKRAKEKGVDIITGYYYPTAKNAMVKEFYLGQGFEKLSEDEKGNSIWEFVIPDNYQNKQDVIVVSEEEK